MAKRVFPPEWYAAQAARRKKVTGAKSKTIAGSTFHKKTWTADSKVIGKAGSFNRAHVLKSGEVLTATHARGKGDFFKKHSKVNPAVLKRYSAMVKKANKKVVTMRQSQTGKIPDWMKNMK